MSFLENESSNKIDNFESNLEQFDKIKEIYENNNYNYDSEKALRNENNKEKSNTIKKRKNKKNKNYINDEERKQEFKFDDGLDKDKLRTKPIFKEYNSKLIFNFFIFYN